MKQCIETVQKGGVGPRFILPFADELARAQIRQRRGMTLSAVMAFCPPLASPVPG